MAAVNGASGAESPVTVSLEELKQGSVPLHKLEQAFGPDSLGIIIVKDLPEKFASLRETLLSYSSYLANLPDDQLSRLEHEAAKYLVGWSLGKEKLKSGSYDTLKGSYYVNCAFYKDPSLQAAPTDGYPDFPEYTAPNVWPEESVLPGFKHAFEELCTLMIDTAVLVARACDVFGLKNVDGYREGYLERVVRTSMTTKARLLHYFPNTTGQANGKTPAQTAVDGDEDDWCATHVDHGCLTALTSAMFVDEQQHVPSAAAGSASLAPLPELPRSPDPKAGLYIHSRTGQVTKVAIPRDCLAFQTGEALELITKGAFKAVPHFVRGTSPGSGATNGMKVARNTLAVFTQPNLWEVVDEGRAMDMAAFAKEVVARHV